MARSRGRVLLNGKGIQNLVNNASVVDDIRRRTEAVSSTAQTNAPVESGAYRDSIKTEVVSSKTAGYTELFDRPVGRVTADVDYAAKIEARDRVLGSAIEAARD